MIHGDITFQKKHLCGIFRALFCPSLDKGKMESVYSVHQQTTVDGFPGYKGVREAKVWDGWVFYSNNPFFMGHGDSSAILGVVSRKWARWKGTSHSWEPEQIIESSYYIPLAFWTGFTQSIPFFYDVL